MVDNRQVRSSILLSATKIEAVCAKLDKVECVCGQDPSSPFNWLMPGRLAVVCRVCDFDLISKYGSEESVPGCIDLGKWSWQGRSELRERIKKQNKSRMKIL